MSQVVTTPDGVEHEFPDETTDDVIKKTLKAYTAGAGQSDADKIAAASVTGWGGTKEFGRSVGEGAVSLLDLPTKAANFIRNVPALTTNAGIEAAKNATPEQLKERGVDPAIVNMKPEATVASPDINTSLYNYYLPPDPEHQTARKAGNIAGSILPTIVAPELLAGKIPALIPALTDTATTTATTYLGGQGGRAIDQALGGTGDKGEFFGSAAGGSITPLVRNVAEGTARSILTDAESAQRLADAKAAGVTPSLDLVGSNRAASFSRGSAFDDLRRAQQKQIDESAQRNADQIAQAATPGQPIPPRAPFARGNVGEQAKTVAQGAIDTAAQQGDQVFQPIRSAVEGRPAPDPTTQATIQNLRANPDLSATARPTLDYHEAISAADRRMVADPQLEAQLDAHRNAVLALGQPTAAAQQVLDAIETARAANRAPSGGALIMQRSQMNNPVNSAETFHARTLGDIQHARGEDLRNAAATQGLLSHEFDYRNQEFGRLQDNEKILNQILDTSPGVSPGETPSGTAYNAAFGKTGEENIPLTRALQEHADPTQLAQLMARNLELRTRGPQAAGRPELPRNVGLNPGGAKWWLSLTPEERSLYTTNPDILAKIDATTRLIGDDARRGGTSQIENYPGMALGGASALMGQPGKAIANVTPKVANFLIGRQMRDPRFTENLIAGGSTPITIKDLARTMAAAVGNARQP